MSCIGQAGRRIVYGFVFLTAPAIGSAQTAGAGGGAKISAPLGAAVDPFANSKSPVETSTAVDPIPTPIVTSSGRVAEASAALKPLGNVDPSPTHQLQAIAPQNSSGMPATPVGNVIDAGKLVPLSSPNATVPSPTSQPSGKSQSTREPTPDDKLAEMAPSGLKPIQPATISRNKLEVPAAAAVTKAKPTAAKKPAAKTKTIEPAVEPATPATNFSFPQPVIPLESAIRKLWQWTLSRR